MRTLVLASALSLAACGNKWSTLDTVLSVTAGSATVADWGQSAAIANGCLEENPVIGKCGEMAGPHLYFATLLGVGALLMPALPTWARRTVLVTASAFELYTVRNNADRMSGWWVAPAARQ